MVLYMLLLTVMPSHCPPHACLLVQDPDAAAIKSHNSKVLGATRIMCVLTATFGPEAVERCKAHYPTLFQKTMDNLLHLIFVRLRAGQISGTR